MNRSFTLIKVLCVMLVGMSAGSLRGEAPANDALPNFVFILADDCSYYDIASNRVGYRAGIMRGACCKPKPLLLYCLSWQPRLRL